MIMLIICVTGQAFISYRRTTVGASLFAKASVQSAESRPGYRLRKQARFHRESHYCRIGYSALHNARQLSSMRLEKPHSLSYQASTLSSLPLALVWLASKIDDSGLWLKSLETNGRVL